MQETFPELYTLVAEGIGEAVLFGNDRGQAFQPPLPLNIQYNTNLFVMFAL